MAQNQANVTETGVDRLAKILRHVPIPGGADITDEPVMAGSHAVYLLAREADGRMETPIFPANNQSAEEALPIFSSREAGVLYMQVARWDQYQLQDYTPRELSRWVNQFAQEGIRFLMADPNRHDQARGIEQPIINLKTLRDISGENLYEEIRAVRNVDHLRE